MARPKAADTEGSRTARAADDVAADEAAASRRERSGGPLVAGAGSGETSMAAAALLAAAAGVAVWLSGAAVDMAAGTAAAGRDRAQKNTARGVRRSSARHP